MLNILDKIACTWIDWREKRRLQKIVTADPELREEMQFKKITMEDGRLDMVMSHPAVFTLADEFAGLLNEFGGDNYFEFDMLPRIDRGVRPIRVTIQ
jgi:hypothetical protein